MCIHICIYIYIYDNTSSPDVSVPRLLVIRIIMIIVRRRRRRVIAKMIVIIACLLVGLGVGADGLLGGAAERDLHREF